MSSFEVYAKQCRIELGKSIKDRKKIYFDTNYWVYLCDSNLNKLENETIKDIYTISKKLVTDQQAIFPISYRIFTEVLKQTDKETLSETIRIIDELSEGVTILSENERFEYELLYFFYTHLRGEDSVFEPNVFVWNKMPYVLGFLNPTLPFLSTQENEATQKRFFEYMWNISLTDMIAKMGMKAIESYPKEEDISENLNKSKISSIKENASLHATFMSEIAGTLDVHGDKLASNFKYLYEEIEGKPKGTSNLSSHEIQLMTNMIYNIFDLGNMGVFLPSIDIEAKLHAVIRWNTNRKYKSHDFNDIGHVKTALPYFDYMFTERPFCSLVKEVKYDEKYDCVVEWKKSDVKMCLEKISSDKNKENVL